MWPFQRKRDPILTDLLAELKAIRDLKETQSEPNSLQFGSDAVLLRLESLEGRFEELRGQCLRHLQSASQRLKLAERKEEELEGEVDLAPGNGQMPLPLPQQEAPISDMEWARRELFKRGELPVTGG